MSSPPELLTPPKLDVVDEVKSAFTYAPTVKHPRGQLVDILGINRADRGRHCEEHAICGHSLEENSLVHICREVFAMKDKGKMVEQAALFVYYSTPSTLSTWVSTAVVSASFPMLMCRPGHFLTVSSARRVFSF